MCAVGKWIVERFRDAWPAFSSMILLTINRILTQSINPDILGNKERRQGIRSLEQVHSGALLACASGLGRVEVKLALPAALGTVAQPLGLPAAGADVNGQRLFPRGTARAVRAQAAMLAAGIHGQNDVIGC